jgi:hypothetical protein
MIALYCADLTAYQRNTANGANSLTSSDVNRNTIVWLQPTATIAGPLSTTSVIAWQNKSHKMSFDVIKDFTSIGFMLDSFPLSGQLTFGGNVTWRLITKQVNTG